jgi:hypothetical protein
MTASSEPSLLVQKKTIVTSEPKQFVGEKF